MGLDSMICSEERRTKGRCGEKCSVILRGRPLDNFLPSDVLQASALPSFDLIHDSLNRAVSALKDITT